MFSFRWSLLVLPPRKQASLLFHDLMTIAETFLSFAISYNVYLVHSSSWISISFKDKVTIKSLFVIKQWSKADLTNIKTKTFKRLNFSLLVMTQIFIIIEFNYFSSISSNQMLKAVSYKENMFIIFFRIHFSTQAIPFFDFWTWHGWFRNSWAPFRAREKKFRYVKGHQS